MGDQGKVLLKRFTGMRMQYTLLAATICAVAAALAFASATEFTGIDTNKAFLGATAFMVVLSGLATYAFTGRLIRPIMALRDSAEAIARGNFNASLEVGGDSEVGDLADSIRAMVARFNDNAARIHSLAYEDPITGLANRAVLEEALADPGLTSGAVMFVDLDHFKTVNDIYGHAAGDQLLRESAKRLMADGLGLAATHEDAPTDTVAFFRFAGDKFVVLVKTDTCVCNLSEMASRLVSSMAPPFYVGGQRVNLGCSIGIARIGVDARTPDELTKFSEMAMYEAKKAGRNRCSFFDEELRSAAITRAELEGDLPAAIANGELTVHYQPKFSVADLRMVGVEALVRWKHPTRGLLHPGSFLPIAETKGLMDQIGREVLRQSALQLSEWEARGFITKVAINVCPTQFLNEFFARDVIRLTSKLGVDPARIIFEITETVAMSDGSTANEQLSKLREAGFRIAIDDFGIGYSNLSQLYKLEFDCLKLDRSLIEAIDTDKSAERIVAYTIGMAHDLNHAVVAEGIERQSQLDTLVRLGCDTAQGFLLAKPMEAEAVHRLHLSQEDAAAKTKLHEAA